MFLDCGRKPEYPVRTHAQGEHTNSMQKDPWLRVKPRTFLLQGNSATKCATVQPHELGGYCTFYMKQLFLQMAMAVMEAFPNRPSMTFSTTKPDIEKDRVSFALQILESSGN
ncbi:hypothetical protein ATANTOWER_028719 [Ataeniobius toweri]|uniref:Uncharacterized protein n=1 Tax=Ataeniobius toweri TaxID=208326 RepID=A0ABU7BI06_9TELE|nr:hypothetical protein [Ataeniobius toweri]